MLSRWLKRKSCSSCLLIELYTLMYGILKRNGIYARKEGETDLYPKPQSSVSNKSTCWNGFNWPYPCIVTKLITSDVSDQQEKNTPTTR